MHHYFCNFSNTITALILMSIAASPSYAEPLFPEPAYVSLKESNQVAKYPGQTIWQGGPKMLYNSVTPDGKILVVSSPKEGSIYIFDTQSGKQLASVKTGKAAKGLKISPDGKEVYVSNEGANTITVIDLASRKAVATIKTDIDPHNVRFTRDGKLAYVTLQGGAGLGVIDTKKRKLIKVYATPGIDSPHNLDLSKDEKTAFIRDLTGLVGALDLSNGKMKKIIKVGQGHAGIDVIPNGKLLFTGAIADDIVTVIDTRTLKVVKKIKVGFGPHGVRASKDNRYLYVAITADDKLSVIDINTLTVVKDFTVTSFPFWIAVNGNP
ncbi:MAG: YncE family protein [Thiohalomonadales bacterium]